MKEKPLIKHYKPAEFREFIQKYRINQPMLCQAIGMNENVFKNKLYQSHPTYFFSDEEYIAILEALSAVANDIRRIIKRAAPGGTMKIKPENMGEKSQNFRATPFLKSHESML